VGDRQLDFRSKRYFRLEPVADVIPEILVQCDIRRYQV
jgi:hypothetical protein